MNDFKIEIAPNDPLKILLQFNSIEERDQILKSWSNHTLFMPRNEEEILRGMVQLSNEIRFVSDLPHLLILFDRQTPDELHFNIILLRILKSKMPPASELFTGLPMNLEMTKNMGIMRNKYQKEAALYSAHLLKGPYFRPDRSIDVYKARQFLVAQIGEKLGPVRDFNGGMISRERRLLKAIEEISTLPIPVVERYFYSLNPPIMRTQINPVVASLLFDTVEKEPSALQFKECEEGIIAAGPVRNRDIHTYIKESLVSLTKSSHELAVVFSSTGSTFGVAFTPTERALRATFRRKMEIF